MRKRVLFMGSDPIALPWLKWLVESGEVTLAAVYTQPDRPRGRGKKVVPNAIKRWALERGIEARQPGKMKKEQRIEIQAEAIDAIFVMAYGHLLSAKLIDTPKIGIWNFHTSILPKYRGASPIQCAVANGEETTGVSLMRMVKAMDAGPVLDVERVKIGRTETALDIDEKLSEACVPLLQRNLASVLDGAANPMPQDDAKATYARKMGKDDGVLDFREPAAVVAKRINGLFSWPGTRFPVGDAVIKVGRADWGEHTEGEAPGTILGLRDGAIDVACGEGTLRLLELQRPGGRMMEAVAFANGFHLPAGTVLESRPMPELVSS